MYAAGNKRKDLWLIPTIFVREFPITSEKQNNKRYLLTYAY
jgi:hypothetical protein